MGQGCSCLGSEPQTDYDEGSAEAPRRIKREHGSGSGPRQGRGQIKAFDASRLQAADKVRGRQGPVAAQMSSNATAMSAEMSSGHQRLLGGLQPCCSNTSSGHRSHSLLGSHGMPSTFSLCTCNLQPCCSSDTSVPLSEHGVICNSLLYCFT